MKTKRILAAVLAVLLLPLHTYAAEETTENAKYLNIPIETTLAKSELGNPFLGFDENGDILYGGDPSILVDGDTVYAYVGHDAATYEWYQMPDYRAYSSKDLIHWKYENKILDMTQVSWSLDNVTAWASQVIKFKGKYYLLFCTPTNIEGEGQGHCIGVAECDTPTGNFIPMDKPLILNSQTGMDEAWYDIDPTAWIDKDEKGNDETLYIGWGNTDAYVCQADVNEEGHLYVIDQNNNGVVSKADGDIVQFSFKGNPAGASFTEASYFYRQQDEKGNYYGDYYVFYAAGWREQMAYSTTKDLMSGELEFGGIVMPPSPTCGTNHPAVFDYKGQSYFVYHTGALPWGSGVRRCVCMDEFSVNGDGTIDPIMMTSTGISGDMTQIFDHEGVPIAHEPYVNPLSDAQYPMRKDILADENAKTEDAAWELEKGKADPDKDAYVSIQSYNKPGLYLCAEDNKIVLTQDDKKDDKETAAKMTFRTLEGFAGYGVSFESVAKPGYYLASVEGDLILSDQILPEACTFQIQTDTKAVSLEILKTKRLYTVGSKLQTDDIRVIVHYENGNELRTNTFTTNADSIDMNRVGNKQLKITYKEGDTVLEESVPIRVVKESRTANVVKAWSASSMIYEEADSLVKKYTFENDLNGADMQKLHNDGIYNGSAVYGDGKYGKGILLGDYGLKLNVGELGEDYTISMWVNPSSEVLNYSSLLFLGTPKGAAEQWVSLTGDGNGGIRLWSTGDSLAWETAFSGILLPVHTWSHITLTQKGNQATLYLNGEEKGSGSAARPLMNAVNDIYIGVNHWDSLYQGMIDEVTVYDEALSAAQAAALYAPKLPETVLEETGFEVEEAMDLYTGVSTRLQAGLPNGIAVSDAEISYASDTPQTVTVDKTGLLTGVQAGDAVITTTVTVGNVTKTADTRVTVVDAKELKNIPLAAGYDMNGGENGVITDISGNGNHATIVNPGATSYVKDGERTVLQIQDTDGYITLPYDIYTTLTDKEAFTIETTFARTKQDAYTAWLFCMGSKTAGKNYLFFSPFFEDKIRAGIKDSSVEKIYQSNYSLEVEQYYTVSMVYDHGMISLYVDGVLAGPPLKSGMSMEKIINDGTSEGILGYIGKSCWSADSNLLAKIDSFKIYDKALSASEIQLLNPECREVLKKQLDTAVSEETIIGDKNESIDKVSCDMNLVNNTEKWNIGWISSNPSVIAANGTVTNPKTETEVTLTAYISYGMMTVEKSFTVTVLPLDLSEVEAMLSEAKSLDYSLFKEDSASGMMELLTSLEKTPLSELQSQQEVQEIRRAFIKAASGLVYIDEYKDPWNIIAKSEPKARAFYHVGETETLFELPEELENGVTVTYTSDNEEVAVYEDGKARAAAEGTAILTVTVTAKADGFPMEYSTCVEVGENAGGLPYVDVAEGDWFYDAAAYTYYEGLMTGTDTTHFAPYNQLARAQFALILYRMEGEPAVNTDKSFGDIRGDEWYGPAVLWAAEQGIVTGYTDTKLFGPADNITREQMVVMMHRYAKYLGKDTNVSADYSNFADASSVSGFAEKAMGWAVGNGIIAGKDNGTKIEPWGNTSRAEAAIIIQRFMKE